MLVITFYDENRAETGHALVGPWRGTFDWQAADGHGGRTEPRARGPSCGLEWKAPWARSRSTTWRFAARPEHGA
jgi:hypothetical protein